MSQDDPSWRLVLCERGIESCRQGDWKKGLEDLKTARRGSRALDLPPRAYSYLGYALAKVDGNVREGLKLCRFAITRQFYEPEHYANLARTHLLERNRKEAHRAIERGLRIDGESLLLHHVLHKELGIRRPPVVPFFSRRHPLNRLLGSMRHNLVG